MAAAELSAASGAAQVQGGRLGHLAAFMQEEDEGGEAAGEAPAAEAPTGKKSKGGKQVHVHIY